MGVAQLDVGVDAWAMNPAGVEELLAFWEAEHRPDGTSPRIAESWGRTRKR